MTQSAYTPASLPASRSKTTFPAAEREGRERRARTEPMAVRPLRDGRYAVETDGGTYVVALDADTCTCPDNSIRGARCKHLHRVELEVRERLVPRPGERTAVCAVCGGRTFVPMDVRSPALCPRHDVRPGDLVRDRETGDRLVVVAATGERTDRFETEEGRLVADYPTNADYGAHEPVFRAVYFGALRRDGDVKRYAFPASRLRPVESRSVDRTDAPPVTDGTASVSPPPA